MKKAFTMIELIFVIVIIGILAAVAIPKISATRDDAAISAIVSNARVAIGDLESFYMSRDNTAWNTETIQSATSALLLLACENPTEANTSISPNKFVLCHDKVICLSLETTVEGDLVVTDGTDTTDTICQAVKKDPAIINMSNKTYVLGGQKIKRYN